MSRPMNNNGIGRKPKDFFGSIKKILKYTKMYLPMLIVAVVFVVVSTVVIKLHTF